MRIAPPLSKPRLNHVCWSEKPTNNPGWASDTHWTIVETGWLGPNSSIRTSLDVAIEARIGEENGDRGNVLDTPTDRLDADPDFAQDLSRLRADVAHADQPTLSIVGSLPSDADGLCQAWRRPLGSSCL